MKTGELVSSEKSRIIELLGWNNVLVTLHNQTQQSCYQRFDFSAEVFIGVPASLK